MIIAEVCPPHFWMHLLSFLYIKSLLKSARCRRRNKGPQRRTALVVVTRSLHTYKAKICLINFSISNTSEFFLRSQRCGGCRKAAAPEWPRECIREFISPCAKLLIGAEDVRMGVWSRQSTFRAGELQSCGVCTGSLYLNESPVIDCSDYGMLSHSLRGKPFCSAKSCKHQEPLQLQNNGSYYTFAHFHVVVFLWQWN